jgi:hypothetical protein
MLHKEAVDSPTLELIKQLQEKDYLHGFHLVGGTAIALMLGHRKSVDVDLFSDFSFDTAQLLENISVDFDFNLFFSSKNTLKGSIEKIQVDILAHRYPLISKPVTQENISMLSLPDIIAMKLNAIATSGQRAKDFIDIYYLLDNYSIVNMINFYKKKYSQYNEVNILKSLVYFDDVDLSDWPQIMADPELEWDTVKQRLIQATKKYMAS